MLPKKEFPKGTAVLFISLLTLFAIAFFTQSSVTRSIPQDLIAVLRPHAIPLQPFSLINKNAQPFTKSNLKGKWSFIFFGYTHCPDICPTTLNTLKYINKALKKNPETASDVQIIFVSVDPKRDKTEMLAKYTAYYNKEFIGITGSADELLGFSKQFAAAYVKEKTDPSGGYLMAHTSSIFLVDPKIQFVASFSPPHDIATITSQYLKIHDIF